jgi:hypothetical protein
VTSAVFNRQISVLFISRNNTAFIDLSKTALTANIGFTVERNLDAEPSTASITIHNLSKDTQESLGATVDGWTVELVAGYGPSNDAGFNLAQSNTSVIFKGDVRTVRHRREPPVLMTEIEADDGGVASKKFVTKHFGKNTTTAAVFRWLQEQSGLGAGNVGNITNINKPSGLPDRLKNGMTIRGYVMDEISSLASGRGARISSQDGEITVLAPGEALAGATLTEMSPATGLIGYPYVDNEGVLTLNHRLLPNVFPGSPIKLDYEGGFANANYVVERAVYSGSLYGDDFNIEIEGIVEGPYEKHAEKRGEVLA